jgi:hypothetical protein
MKNLPKDRHLSSKVRLLDDQVRPGARDQLVLCHQFSGLLHQCDQDFKRSSTDQNRPVVLEQEMAIGMQAKWTKRDRGIGRSRLLIGCFGRSQAGLQVI